MHEMPRTDEGGFQHIVYNSVNHQQLWDDTLMMSVMPLTKIGLLLNRPHYVEEAKRQFLLHIKYLVDRKTGLWFHGWDFNGRHNFAEARWARGNSWITIVIPDFLELTDLPETDPTRRMLVATLDARGVATVRRLAQDGAPLAAGERLLPVKRLQGDWVLVTDAFYFPEGQGEPFAQARFGEFRALPDGRALLVGLADEHLQPIAPAPRKPRP